MSINEKHIIRKANKKTYTVLDNSLIQNKSMSWKAKGMLCYLLSLPDDWNFCKKHLIDQASDGKESFESGWKELKKLGFITVECQRSKNGTIEKWFYTVHETPILQSEDIKKQSTTNRVSHVLAKPLSGKPATTKYLEKQNPKQYKLKTLSSEQTPILNGTMAFSNVENDVEKFKLNAEQRTIFEWLKKQGIDSVDKTLCYWAKTFSFSRLKDVVLMAKREPRKSVGAYINKLLRSNAIVETDIVRENRELAIEYKSSNHWKELQIFEKHAKCKDAIGKEREIEFSLKSNLFLSNLMQMHTLYQKGESFDQERKIIGFN